VHSEKAYTRELKTLNKKVQKEYDDLAKKVWHTENIDFGCEKDADKYIKKVQKDLKFHTIESEIQKTAVDSKKGRPKSDSKPDDYKYKTICKIRADQEKIELAKITKEKFIFATNQLDKEKITDSEILSTYKEQQGVERGFKFIKDDAFEVDSIFLKKPVRIEALMMIMVLCLLVYGYMQFFIREELKRSAQTVQSQTGKETQNPSAKWIYFLMDGIHVLNVMKENVTLDIVLNMNAVRKKIVSLFSEQACKMDGLEE
jgi:transposase